MQGIVTENISKSYPVGKTQTTALESISFAVNKGEIFGLIGPDGAGKTSLIRILTTLLFPDAGNAFVDGHNVLKEFKTIRNLIGYMPGRFSLYQDLSVEENLQFFASIFNTTIRQNYHLIKYIYEQIEPFKHRKAGKLSGGMKQKLALSCALIHKPSVLFLDEPTTGVDAVSRKEFWQMLKKLQQQGLTILVATPYMDEASLCDRVALMQQGRMLEIDTPQGVVQKHYQPVWAIKSGNMHTLLHALREMPGAASVYPFGEYHHLTTIQPIPDVQQLTAYLQSRQQLDVSIKLISPGIEDVFMQLMNQPYAA